MSKFWLELVKENLNTFTDFRAKNKNILSLLSRKIHYKLYKIQIVLHKNLGKYIHFIFWQIVPGPK